MIDQLHFLQDFCSKSPSANFADAIEALYKRLREEGAPRPLSAQKTDVREGTDLGARLTHKIDRSTLHIMMIFLVSLMAVYMSYKALT
jgi:hypothetical protein